MVAMDSGADNGFFYTSQVMHFSSPFTVFLIYHKQYIDCLIMNYTDLGSEKINTALDIASGLASGSILGFSLKDLALDSKEVVLTALVLFVIQAIKASNLLFRKWNFYISVLQQIKDELSERED